MKNTFREFQTGKFTDANWRENSIIIFDTNVLLNLYKVTESSRRDAFKLLESVKEQCWIPHHVGLEFYVNLDEVKNKNKKKLSDLKKEIRDSLDSLKSRVNSTFREKVEGEPSSLAGIESTEIEELLNETKDKVLEIIQKVDNDGHFKTDGLRSQIETFLEGRVGKPYSKEELKKHCETAKSRLQAKVPPMESKDGKKTDSSEERAGLKFGEMTLDNPNNAYGDYLVWRQILDFAKTEEKNVVFVSNDKKAWRIQNFDEFREVPSSLEIEFNQETSQRILFSSASGFYHKVNEEQSLEVSDATINRLSIPSEETINRLLDSSSNLDYEKIDFSLIREAFNNATWPHQDINGDLLAAIKMIEQRASALKEVLDTNQNFFKYLNTWALQLQKEEKADNDLE